MVEYAISAITISGASTFEIEVASEGIRFQYVSILRVHLVNFRTDVSFTHF